MVAKDETDGNPCPRQTILVDPEQAVKASDDLKQHILDVWVRPGLRAAQRHPVSTALVALITLKHYLDIFGSEEGVHASIYTRETVEQLLACQASEFADVRKRARVMYVHQPYHTNKCQGLMTVVLKWQRSACPGTSALYPWPL